MKNKSPEQTDNGFIIGIDVSKESLDACLIVSSTGNQEFITVGNTSQGYQKMKRWIRKYSDDDPATSLYCLEHTGIYTRNLVKYLLSRGYKVWVESSLQIKRSMGLVRGKSDKIDAYRIARYAMLHQREAKLVRMTGSSMDRLSYLMRMRSRLLKSQSSHQQAINEMAHFDKKAGKEMERMSRAALNGIKKSLEKTNAKMLEIVDIDKEVRALYELITSVKSVGQVLALDLIVYTHGFTRMLDGRKLACYCGVAPFEYRSGTSIHGSPGTSKFANRILKAHLHMAAINAIRHHAELREYYKRKLEAGKGKMSAINAVRNKLLHRVVAVVKRGTPYVEKL